MLRQLVLILVLGVIWTTAAFSCTKMFPSQPPPSSVNSVRPSDVSVLSFIGFKSPSSELSTVSSRLRDLLSMYNPDLISHLPDDTNAFGQHRNSLVVQAKEVTFDMQNNQHIIMNRDWKLVLLFVQVDQLCVCEQQQISSVIRSAVTEVDKALHFLHSQLQRTIVSIALWDGETQSNDCVCKDRISDGEHRLEQAMLTHALLESLDELMVQRKWYSDREDFVVTLQDVPLIGDQSFFINKTPLSDSKASQHSDRLTVQIWSNLLQPTVDQPTAENNGEMLTLPCPTEERAFLRTEGNSPSYHHSNDSPLLHPFTGTAMPCNDFSPSESTPTTVHELRPADIKVVAAVGDSLTAGNGIPSGPNNILDVLSQYRGLSWSVGGDDNLTTVTTLPNILKYFNPSVTGFSVGKGKQDTPQAFLNQAVTGAKSTNVPTQVQALVARMKNDSRINFETDWKVISVFIGGNDLCDFCYNSLRYSMESYARNVRQSLDYLHQQVPRAFVNLIEPLHITPLREMHLNSSVNCPTWLVDILCPCVILPKPNSKALEMAEEMNRGYQRVLNELVESGRYDTRPDFTVVVQPFFREIVVPKLPDGRPDRSYFSADCFHLSQKSQTLMARALWNNMLEPLGNKTVEQDFMVPIDLKCPSKNSPFIRTYNNSEYEYAGPSPTPGPVTNWGSDFSCNNHSPSETVPSSVHKLRPADIKVVAALGDSTTAATGAKAQNLFQLDRNDRGVSWSIGGDGTLDTVTTIPNILKKFNPSLKGFSRGSTVRQKGFNMAVAGAKTSDILAQVQALIQALKGNKEVNFENDWKMVTIFIGGNDLCHYCLDQNNLSPKNYSHSLMLGLDMLYKEVPKVLVNVVEIMQIAVVKSVKKNTLGCSLLQRVSCPCVINPSENSPEMEEIKRINHQYQVEIQYLLSSDRYDGKEDFAVVLQPFLLSSFIPQTGDGMANPDFFSLDCFHISDRTHAEMAIALWNNMLEPVGRKQAYNNFTHDRTKIHCPSEASPFIFTKTNSQPSPPVTTSVPTTTTITAPTVDPTFPETKCPISTPIWVPVLVGTLSLLAGTIVAWFIMSCTNNKKNKYSKEGEEMKATGL
ncbi:phospholipase B1, membrane-associated-like [Gouania willdenowi]|uniref:phospholipase B1, membrane-associated-like n=1 Tax=Gouania willdenowi TaxID=441366 RepID=UPI001054C4DE|nr:phospholipase B1, membrane-associated-like [Gouania willdenowi]